jgi:hypothetical protein
VATAAIGIAISTAITTATIVFQKLPLDLHAVCHQGEEGAEPVAMGEAGVELDASG